MFKRAFLTGVAMTVLVLQACGSDSGKKKVPRGEAGAGGEGGEVTVAAGGSAAGEAPEPAGGRGGEAPQPTAGMPPQGGMGGAGGEPPTPPEYELLFSVRPGATGLEGTAIADADYPENGIFTSESGSQQETEGDNQLKLAGTALGLAETDQVVTFTEPRPEPQNPLFLFSVADGSGGAFRVLQSYNEDGTEEGDVYFSDGKAFQSSNSEAGDATGYNALFATEGSLGLAVAESEAIPNNDDLTGLLVHDKNQPLTELYFVVSGAAAGAEGSAVAATDLSERGCTVFKSTLDGTNEVAFTCAELGLLAGDQIDALMLWQTQDGPLAIFSVTFSAYGEVGSAVEASWSYYAGSYPATGTALFSSVGDGTNQYFKEPPELGLSEWSSAAEIDAVAVVDVPPAAVVHQGECTPSFDPFDANEGALTSFEAARQVGDGVLVMFGATDASARLLAYDANSCELLQQRDMPSEFASAYLTAIVPHADWAKATPLDGVDYLHLVYNTGYELHRYDDQGNDVQTVALTGYGANPASLVYEPVNQKLYLTDPFAGELAVLDVPDGAATDASPEYFPQILPWGWSLQVTGTDPQGNLLFAQGVLADPTPVFRVSAFSPLGEMLPAPYAWEPQLPAEESGFIASNGMHYLLSTNDGAGPVTIERGKLSLP